MKDAGYWIERLGLEEHPEGGYYRETYRAAGLIAQPSLPAGVGGPRSFSTTIYYLLPGNDFSAFHRIRSDELWHHYAGSALTVHVLEPAGRYRQERVGPDPDAGEAFQAVVAAGCWFGATVDEATSYALVGCTVAPGFDFQDFEVGRREELLRLFPSHRAIIERLSRDGSRSSR